MPVNVPAGAITTLPEAAVIKPLAFTVNVGIDVDEPKDPTLAFTVARVVTAEFAAEVDISPLNGPTCFAAKSVVKFVT